MRALFILLTAGVALAQPELDRHPWSQAVEIRTRAYVVQTNTFPELAEALAGRLEEAYVLFQDRFGPLRGEARRSMRVQLFRTRREYLESGDGVAGAVGHFDAASDRCALYWRPAAADTGWPIAVHEACHHYFRRRYPHLRTPSWYSEGIACYLEGALDPTTVDGVARLRIRAAKAGLRQGQARLDHLLDARAVVRAGRLELDHFTPTRYYGLAWSFVHFLARDARYRAGFRRFELRLFAKQPLPSRIYANARQLLAEECGDLGTLERGWREHLRALPEPEAPRLAPTYAWELASDRAFVRFAALRRLGHGRLPRDLRAAVFELRRDRDIIVRALALSRLAYELEADTVPALVEALDAGDDGLKSLALRALAHPVAVDAVPRLLRETEQPVAALRALASIGDPRAFPALRAAVVDTLVPAGIRVRCATALATDPRARTALELATRDEEVSVRNAARAALRKAAQLAEPAPRDDVGLLVAILVDALAPTSQKRHACTHLARLGAKEAVPALRRLCRDDVEESVRLAAAQALAEITGAKPAAAR